MATTDLHFVAGGLEPFKRGMRFLGGNVDDQVQINASGAAMANSFLYGTFMADICVPDNTGTYAVLGYGDDNVVEHITMRIAAGKLEVECNDNTTVQWKYVTAANTIVPHRIHNVCVVQDGVEPLLYIDGNKMTITRTTSTTPASWFKACAGIDAGSIGAAEMTGDAALTQEFKGYIANVKVWGSATTTTNVALTQDQVKVAMAGGSVGAPYNSWDLDQNVVDTGTGADNGTIVGDLIYSDFNEFSSRLTFLETVPLTADNINVTADQGIGYAYSVLAA